MNTFNNKYAVIRRGINGKLFAVIGADTKREVNKIVSYYADKGYQLKVVSRMVLLTASNLEEERSLINVNKI